DNTQSDLTLPPTWSKVADFDDENVAPQFTDDQAPNPEPASGPVQTAIPANYTPEDPLDLQGKQPVFQSMQTDWYNLPPQEGEKAVVNAFRATMLSPRQNLRSNAVLYQLLMD